MQTLIDEYVNIIKPADIECLTHLEELFQKINYKDHMSLASDIHTIPNNDRSLQGSMIVDTYSEHAETILHLMGVTFLEDVVPLNQKEEILSLLNAAEEPINQDVLESIISTHIDTSPDELICYLFEELSDKPYTYYRFIIAEVELTLIHQLKENITTIEIYHDIVTRIKEIKSEYIKISSGYRGILHSIIIKTTALPISYNANIAELINGIEELPLSDIVKEIYLFLIITGTERQDRERLGYAVIENYFDYAKQIKLSPMYDSLIKGLTDEEL